MEPPTDLQCLLRQNVVAYWAQTQITAPKALENRAGIFATMNGKQTVGIHHNATIAAAEGVGGGSNLTCGILGIVSLVASFKQTPTPTFPRDTPFSLPPPSLSDPSVWTTKCLVVSSHPCISLMGSLANWSELVLKVGLTTTTTLGSKKVCQIFDYAKCIWTKVVECIFHCSKFTKHTFCLLFYAQFEKMELDWPKTVSLHSFPGNEPAQPHTVPTPKICLQVFKN
jgi:hypothetical protein